MHLSIGEVAARSGVAASAIRYWERLGLLPTPERSAGRRRYGLDVFDRIEDIRVAQAAGLDLEAVGRLLRGLDGEGDPEWARFAWRTSSQLQELARRAVELAERLRAPPAPPAPPPDDSWRAW